ncbi:MAG: tRNA 2-thiouridine(34) synthase MnmA [Gammaproteobacteria bacterium]|jgi:tRNA-specific 2-thiouridylase|nr:tRNA 2-thiouridine(34) synthase MnmA [Gammaproteobacteria bacterium]
MKSPTQPKVLVGISGGVDSAVAAALLLDQGYRVEGLHMTNWDADDDYCSAAADLQEARRACSDLGIPLHTANFAAEYRDKVFADFLAEYAAGRTPNPDVACNRYIKFGDCFALARRLGADYFATGHYARVAPLPDGARLLKGLDAGKDQSYFLHTVDAAVLRSVLFPLGALTKTEVRRTANDLGLPNHARKDSTGICFIGERPFREFLRQYLDAPEGVIEAPDGQVVGRHVGLMYYTLGQRQGLGIGGVHGYPDEPWYVAAKDPLRNVLRVVQGRDHPALWYTALETEAATWLQGRPPAVQFACTVRTRYRQADVACTVECDAAGALHIAFAEPVWAVTPGQHAVLYNGDECLGGGIIKAGTPVADISADRAPLLNTA